MPAPPLPLTLRPTADAYALIMTSRAFEASVCTLVKRHQCGPIAYTLVLDINIYV